MSLLMDIARCPIVEAVFRGLPAAEHCCSAIIRSQRVDELDMFHVPEPWSGRLDTAPILFLSSNPSINRDEQYPTWAWSDTGIDDFFVNRFGGGEKEWVKNQLRPLHTNGEHPYSVRFWAAIRQRAAELLGPEVRPGVDYVTAEVVHCKSAGEEGVWAALDFCADRYLKRLVAESAARVVVALGVPAAYACRRVFSLPTDLLLAGPQKIGERERLFAFLPHPNARRARTFLSCLGPDVTEQLRQTLAPTSASGDTEA